MTDYEPHHHEMVEHKAVWPKNSDLVRVNVLWYDDGCIRFRIHTSPLKVTEMYISGPSENSLITVAPT